MDPSGKTLPSSRSHQTQIGPRGSSSSDSTASPIPTPQTDKKRLYTPEPGGDGYQIPVHVVARQIEGARQHSQDEWEDMKAVIYKLYMEDDRALKVVMRILSEEYNFHATIRMYKIRFRRWGWRKNRVQEQRRDAENRAKGAAAAAAVALQSRIQHLKMPDLLSDQEVPISISRNYTIDQSGSERWNCIVLNMSDSYPSSSSSPDSNSSSRSSNDKKPESSSSSSMVRFIDAETAYVNTIHQLRSGRIKDAFASLNHLFDSMTGSRLYLHPKYLTGFWLLCHGIFNACQWINDHDFRLLRELLCFHGANAAACFLRGSSSESSSSSHPIVSLMASVARMSRDNPATMKQTFRTAYRAAAESLEEKLGYYHPVVLVTWTDYFWYFNFPYDTRKNLVERQEIALIEVERTSGREGDTTICLLHNLVFFLFYCAADDALAKFKLADLLGRTASRIADRDSPTASSFHLQRARAFASVLQGVFILRENEGGVKSEEGGAIQSDDDDIDGRLERCAETIGATTEWLRSCEGSDAIMHTRMLQMDLYLLTTAFKAGKDLRDITLAFAKPRSADYDDTKPRLERQTPGS